MTVTVTALLMSIEALWNNQMKMVFRPGHRDIEQTAAPVSVRGWVRTRRDSKAGISFVHLSDGSSFHPVQVVAPNTLPNYTDEVLKRRVAR